MNAAQWQSGRRNTLPLPLVRVPIAEGRGHARWRGVALALALSALWPQWLLRHTTLRGSPSVTSTLLYPLSHSVVCQCLSPCSLLSSLPPPRSLVCFLYPQEPAEVPPGRRFCPIRSHCNNPRDDRGGTDFLSPSLRLLLLLVLLPHGPASLLLLLCRRRWCCCCRRHRVEGDPDPTLFLKKKKTSQKPHTTKVEQHFFLLYFGHWSGRERAEERKTGRIKKNNFLTQSRRLKGGLSFTWRSRRLARRCGDTHRHLRPFYSQISVLEPKTGWMDVSFWCTFVQC